MITEYTADPVQPFCAAQKSYHTPKLVQHPWIQITAGISGQLGDFATNPTDFMEEQQ